MLTHEHRLRLWCDKSPMSRKPNNVNGVFPCRGEGQTFTRSDLVQAVTAAVGVGWSFTKSWSDCRCPDCTKRYGRL